MCFNVYVFLRVLVLLGVRIIDDLLDVGVIFWILRFYIRKNFYDIFFNFDI